MEQNVNRSVNTEDEIFVGFRWAVAKAGYRLATVLYDTESEPQCSVVDDRVMGTPYKVQNLEKLPELYRTLAAVNTDNPEDIRTFTNNFGLLDHRMGVLPDDGSPLIKAKLTGDGFPLGNTLAFWKEQAWVMKCAVTLWDELRAQNILWLKQRITWRKEGDRFRYRPEPKKNPALRWFEAPKIANVNLREQFKPEGNVLAPARYILQRLINENLTGRVAPMLLRKRTGAFDLYFKPLTLIGALWLQFAQDVTNNHAVRRCDYCKKRRVNGAPQKRYCSDSCKSMAWRAGKTWKQN